MFLFLFIDLMYTVMKEQNLNVRILFKYRFSVFVKQYFGSLAECIFFVPCEKYLMPCVLLLSEMLN